MCYYRSNHMRSIQFNKLNNFAIKGIFENEIHILWLKLENNLEKKSISIPFSQFIGDEDETCFLLCQVSLICRKINFQHPPKLEGLHYKAITAKSVLHILRMLFVLSIYCTFWSYRPSLDVLCGFTNKFINCPIPKILPQKPLRNHLPCLLSLSKGI